MLARCLQLGDGALLLIHGDYGSGKSAALRALEESPPPGLRAAYVPVPTLDFSGLARWCLDRLGAEATPDPPAALRALAGRSRLLLLIDDADRLALDVALALRQLERDAHGGVVIVAACGSERIESPSLVALGPPLRDFVVAAGSFERPVRAVRAALSPESAHAAASAPKRQVRVKAAPAATAGAARRAMLAASPPEPVAAHAEASKPAPREPLPALHVPPPRSSRTVPLSLAIALSAAAFLVPAAFFVGFLLGGSRSSEPEPRTAREASALPEVSAAPRVASQATEQNDDLKAPAPTAQAEVAPAPSPAQARSPAAERVSAPARASAATERASQLARARTEPSRSPAATESRAAKPELRESARPSAPVARAPVETRSEARRSASAAPSSQAPAAKTRAAAPQSASPTAEARSTPAIASAAKRADAAAKAPPAQDPPAQRTAAAAPARAQPKRSEAPPTVEPDWGTPTLISVGPADEAN